MNSSDGFGVFQNSGHARRVCVVRCVRSFQDHRGIWIGAAAMVTKRYCVAFISNSNNIILLRYLGRLDKIKQGSANLDVTGTSLVRVFNGSTFSQQKIM